jgi:hypothetical protein
MDVAAQYAMAYALTTSAGIRALLPLALVSVAVHLGYLHPPQGLDWLGSALVTEILVAFGIAELLADKVPLLDHALHFVQILTKPAAAAILVAGTAHPQSHDVLLGLMILGALNALGVHVFTSSLRVGSTAATGGIANPFLSAAEDAVSAVSAILAFVAPFVAAAIALLILVVLMRAVGSAYGRRRRIAGS